MIFIPDEVVVFSTLHGLALVWMLDDAGQSLGGCSTPAGTIPI
jgi:hypothetical protein